MPEDNHQQKINIRTPDFTYIENDSFKQSVSFEKKDLNEILMSSQPKNDYFYDSDKTFKTIPLNTKYKHVDLDEEKILLNNINSSSNNKNND